MRYCSHFRWRANIKRSGRLNAWALAMALASDGARPHGRLVSSPQVAAAHGAPDRRSGCRLARADGGSGVVAGVVETPWTGGASRDAVRRCDAVSGADAGLPRRSESLWTGTVLLITQRSRVQIPPPLPSLQVRGLFRSWKGPSACAVCTELCTRPLRRAAVATGGETYPRTSFATQTAYDFY